MRSVFVASWEYVRCYMYVLIYLDEKFAVCCAAMLVSYQKLCGLIPSYHHFNVYVCVRAVGSSKYPFLFLVLYIMVSFFRSAWIFWRTSRRVMLYIAIRTFLTIFLGILFLRFFVHVRNIRHTISHFALTCGCVHI